MSEDLKITKLPATTENDPIGFFEAIKMEGLEGRWMRLSASIQKRFFGRAPFGKKAVRVSEAGVITTWQTAGFGRDWDEQSYIFDHFTGKFNYASGLGVSGI